MFRLRQVRQVQGKREVADLARLARAGQAAEVRRLDAAAAGGINFLDTADAYPVGGSLETVGRTEEIIGRWLRGRRHRFIVATKCFGVMGPDHWDRGNSRKHILDAIDGSLRRLGTDYIDLYQIHRWDPVVPIDETLEALNDLVRVGKVRFIGASSGWAWRMMQALSLSERRGWAAFVSMQNHYNAIYREEEREMLPLCREMGIGVIPWSPMARGLLTRPRPASGSVTTDVSARAQVDMYSREIYEGTAQWDVVNAVERVATARGVTMAEVSLAWLLARPGVTAPIVGATKPGHIEAAVRAVDLTLSPEEIAAMVHFLCTEQAGFITGQVMHVNGGVLLGN